MRSRTCVITGATSGIGKAVAVALSARGENLVLISRNERNGCRLARWLEAAGNNIVVEFLRADLSRQADVLAVAGRIAERHNHIDVLINNAGARFDHYQESPEGIEMTFALNHLGHFLLTNRLSQLLTRAPAARVITVSSRVHAGATGEGGWYLDRAHYDRKSAYAKSKLANIMFAYELAERLGGDGVVSNAADPGIAATRFARNNGLLSWLKHLAAHGCRLELGSPRRGAATIVHLAASDSIQGVTGRYFRNCRPVESSPISHDRMARKQLWELSERLTGSVGAETPVPWRS